MTHETCNVLIIGGGPAGYVCAIRAGQLGLDTIVVDQGNVGGTCLNIGCIPSKALIHAAEEYLRAREFAGENDFGILTAAPSIDFSRTMGWKDGIVSRLTGGVSGLLKKAKVRVVTGRASILDGKTVDVETEAGPVRIAAKNLVIATGSVPVELSFLPFDGKVISSTEALSLAEVPKSLAIVGGGYIGLELGTAYAKLGSQVTVIESADRILPQYDADLTKPVMARLKALGVRVLTGKKAAASRDDGLHLESGEIIPAEKILVTVGRAPAVKGFGIDELGLDRDGAFIRADDRGQTSMRGVYAIGDVTGEPMLAHRAMMQGQILAEHLAGNPADWDKRAIPAVCYTDPEIVTVGELPGRGQSVSFPFAGNGRAMTIGRGDGFVRIVYDPGSQLVLGIQAVGAAVSELAGEFALALEMGATLTDLADTIHAHPTLGEVVQEAALKGLGRALHA